LTFPNNIRIWNVHTAVQTKSNWYTHASFLFMLVSRPAQGAAC